MLTAAMTEDSTLIPSEAGLALENPEDVSPVLRTHDLTLRYGVNLAVGIKKRCQVPILAILFFPIVPFRYLTPFPDHHYRKTLNTTRYAKKISRVRGLAPDRTPSPQKGIPK